MQKQNRFKGQCSCGAFKWFVMPPNPELAWHCIKKRIYNGEGVFNFCPHCGYRLRDDGGAERTVVVPEQPIEVWQGRDISGAVALFEDEPGYFCGMWGSESNRSLFIGLDKLDEPEKHKVYIIPEKEQPDGETK